MPYTATIPQPTDRINDSQPLILANFAEIAAALAVNHVGFNLPNVGKHNVVRSVSQGTFPANDPAAFGVTETGLYNLQYNGAPEIFVRKSNAAPGITTSIPMTASSKLANGWTYLPSGLLLKWGFVGTGVILFPAAANIPVFNNVLSAQVTSAPPATRAFLGVTAIANNSITVVATDHAGAVITPNIYYLVIGY